MTVTLAIQMTVVREHLETMHDPLPLERHATPTCYSLIKHGSKTLVEVSIEAMPVPAIKLDGRCPAMKEVPRLPPILHPPHTHPPPPSPVHPGFLPMVGKSRHHIQLAAHG